MLQRICTNFGVCVAAERREVFPVKEGTESYCPLCQKVLSDVVDPDTLVPEKKTNWVRYGAIAATLILLLVGFAAAKSLLGRHGDKSGLVKHNVILRLAGSNTIGESLAPAMAEAFLKDQGATEVRTLPGAAAQEKIVLGMMPGEQVPSAIEIAAHGSATAFTTLASSGCDIGMASRRIKTDEAEKLSSLGNMTSVSSEHIVGLDGIAVIVNASNKVGALGKDQIMRIFSGEITDWAQLGGVPGGISIYARDDKSGTYDTFKNLVLGAKPLSGTARRFEDSNALSDAVSADPNAIGFIGLPFVHSAKAIAVSEKGTGALQPTRLTVATEDYSLSRRLYLYTPANPNNAYARKFIEFAISRQGQDVVASNGFIAQNVDMTSVAVSAHAPEEYRQLTRNAERLSLNFRFQPGASVKDNKAQVDLDRVVALIADHKQAGEKVVLIGFADSTGSASANKALSLNRAQLIESEFIQRGIKPATVRGFGAELPVASNETPEGREKNRRVEIWLEK